MNDAPKWWVVDILLVGILLMGAYFRFIGLSWDGTQHLHPDERFLTMVATSISPDLARGHYFETAQSTLNPNNVGYGFYVYGTLPLFMVRLLADIVSQTGYDQINIVGRAVSGLMDLVTVLLVFLITNRLYRKPRMALLAAAFSAAAVLQIQLSHFFAVDTFQVAFAFMAVYLAVRIMTAPAPRPNGEPQAVDEAPHGEKQVNPPKEYEVWLKGSWASVIPFLLFGLALGMAVASKINSALVAGLLPLAAYIWYSRLPEEHKTYWSAVLIRNIIIAGLAALLAFRIFQPYAFNGPGFFGLSLNEKWVSNMKEVANQSSGDVDFPPALQWARRPVTFAWTNMVEWGLGLPLGLLAWAGFLWMGWKTMRGEWRRHLLLWLWTGFYFTFQSLSQTSSMRYQLLVYPTLAIMASWAVFSLWEEGKEIRQKGWGRLLKAGAWVIGAGVLAWTAAYAYGFTRIYTKPVTRVAASEWIYQNVPGPINLKVETPKGLVNQPLVFSNSAELNVASPMAVNFRPQINGALTQVNFSHVADANMSAGLKNLTVRITDLDMPQEPLSTSTLTGDFAVAGDPRGNSYPLLLTNPVSVSTDKTYKIEIMAGEITTVLKLAGPITLRILDQNGAIEQPLPDPVQAIRRDAGFETRFSFNADGELKEIFSPHIVDWEELPGEKMLTAEITSAVDNRLLGRSSISGRFAAGEDRRGGGYSFLFDPPLKVRAKESYILTIRLTDGEGALAIYGSRQALESTWDDPLPLGLDGYNPYDFNYGIYRSDLNFEMYWDDNQDKLERFLTVMNQADYIFISSNRQWGTTIRVPERYPLTTEYYRSLIGCPDEKDIFWCYAVARPGMFEGRLGYELAATFTSEPTVAGVEFNSQFAEEAFSVYDHPKVLIFKKTPGFRIDAVREILSAVDLSQVIHVTPKRAGSLKGNLMLSPEDWKRQQEGGTWSELFNRLDLQNRYPAVGGVVWYLALTVLGLVSYPLVRIAMNGLPDRGYPFARLAGMVILAWLVWLAGSLGAAFTRLLITGGFALMLAASLALGWRRRHEILGEVRQRWKYFLTVEGITLALFILFLLVRLGNPDLWHPYKGGEKPMDFSYLNAVIKSTTFPPYDPWFAGGYINYYYYGFVIVAVLIKWLGIIPAVAYNLAVPTLFALSGIGAFSLGWNLLASGKAKNEPETAEKAGFSFDIRPLAGGLSAAVGFLILGNLGTVRMVWQSFQKLAAPGGVIENGTFVEHWVWGLRGVIQSLTGAHLNIPAGDWYWVPSRAFPGEPITEFPSFTFLYADLHAHMIALPVTLLALAWALSILLGKWDWDGQSGFKPWKAAGLSLAFGALVIGTLRPTNTWDFPTYLVIGSLALVYTILRYQKAGVGGRVKMPPLVEKILLAAAAAGVLVLFSFLFFQPFSRWFAQGYNAVRLWDGARTPFWSYFTHWGLFLLVNVSHLTWETGRWLATTPARALNKFKPYQNLLWLAAALVPVAAIGLLIYGVNIAWLVVPLFAWTAVMVLRPGLPEMKRFTFFIFGCALFLSLVVEMITLEGDIGRMNTVFKFYMQSWTFMAISAGASLVWLWPAVEGWKPGWRNGWSLTFAVLLGSAALFPLTASVDKITDRMDPRAPHTLDGMKFMENSTYMDAGGNLDLNQDYKAIRWMQDNVQGSPVIVEGNTVEYRWGSRFTIYTGLPGVVGWNWHQRQQRGVVSAEQVSNRVNAVELFYLSADRSETVDFLNRYNVEYIIVGQMERLYYPGFGLEKFRSWNGDLWETVYTDRDTTIYRVKK